MKSLSPPRKRRLARWGALALVATLATSLVTGGAAASPAQAAPADAVVRGTISADAAGDAAKSGSSIDGSADRGLAGVPVKLLCESPAGELAATVTAADGSYSFSESQLGSCASPVKVTIALGSYAGNIYATEPTSADNQLGRVTANTASSGSLTVSAASPATVNGLVTPAWRASLALADGDGMGGKSVKTGTGPFDSGNGDGQDSSDSNNRVRSGDLISYDWNLSFNSPESLGTKTTNAVFEQKLELSAGAVANFDVMPAVCQGTGYPTSQIVAYPSGKVVPVRTAPPAGTTSVVLTCNLGPVGSDIKSPLPSTSVWVSPQSSNGGQISTVTRAYGVDPNGAATIRTSSEIRQGPITVTSAPRYDLEKTALTGPVFGSYDVGQGTVPGQTIDYQVTIAADRKVGVEAFTTPVTFTDSIFGQYANGSSNGPLDSLIPGMKGYVVSCVPTVDGGANQAVMVLGKSTANKLTSSVPDSGTCAYSKDASTEGKYSITLNGIDTSGSRYPTTYVGGAPIPADRFYVASYRLRVFVPYSAIDQTQGGANDGLGAIKLSNQIGGFDPKGVSGASNYDDGFEPGYCTPAGPQAAGNTVNNGCDTMEGGSRGNNIAGPVTLSIAPPGWGKSQFAIWDAWLNQPSFRYGQTIQHDGTAQLQPGNAYGSRVSLDNRSATALSGIGMCDVFDNTTARLSTLDKIVEQPGNAGSVASLHAYVLESGTTGSNSGTDAAKRAYGQAFQANFGVQYAHVDLSGDNANTGVLNGEGVYEGKWSKQRAVNCGNATITWYSNPEDVPGGIDEVNAVRAMAKDSYTLPVGASTHLWIALEQRNEYNGGPHAGELIPAGTVVPNFASVTSKTWNANWSSQRNYHGTPHSTDTDGDRWTVIRANLAVTKETVEVDGIGTGVAPVGETGKALAGDKVVWKVNPSLTASSQDPAPVENVTITDTLPKYVTYNAACTEGLTGGTAPSTVTPNADGTTTLVWNLGTITPNAKIAPRLICTDVDPFTPNGLGLTNVVNVKGDGIVPLKRHTTNHTVTVQQAAALALKKTVDHEVDLQDDNQAYTLTVRNFSPTRTFAEPTVIETLPFNGDATGSAGIKRNPASDFAGSSGLNGPVQAYDASGTRPVQGAVHYTTINPADIPQDLNDDTDASIWSTSVSDYSKVTGFKFVGGTALGTSGSGDAASVLLKFTTKQSGNAPGDWYANRFTAFSKSLTNDDGTFMRLTSNQTNVRVVGFSLGDLIWTDTNNNGVFDEGTDGTAPEGVEVQVYRDGASDPVATVKTDAKGRWHADNLRQGDYYVLIPSSQFAKGAPLEGLAPQGVNVQDASTGANENADHSAIQDAAGVRSQGLVTLAAAEKNGTLTGNGPLGDNVAGLRLPAGTTDDFTNLTVDLALKPVPGYEFTKTADPVTGTPVLAGQDITYTLTGKNTGKTVIDASIKDDLSKVLEFAEIKTAPAAKVNGDSADSKPELNGTDLAWQGELKPGQKVVITYTVTVKKGMEGKTLNNHASSTGTPPYDPPITPPGVETVHPVPGYTFAKSADPASGTAVSPGAEVKYTLTGTNTGATKLDPVSITDELSKVLNHAQLVGDPSAVIEGPNAGTAPAATVDGTDLKWQGALEVGQSVKVTYTVKINADADKDAVVINNHAESSATPPGVPPITPPDVETEHPVPGYAFAKTSDPKSGSTVMAGDTITYTLKGTNTGATVLDPVNVNDDLSKVLNNAALVGEPTAAFEGTGAGAAGAPTVDGTKLSWRGSLKVGQSVVITYKVKVNADADQKAVVLNNKADSDATPPGLPPITPPEVVTEHPVPGYTFSKVSNPVTGSSVSPEGYVTYTLKGINTGATKLDPVSISDDLSKVLSDAKLSGDPQVSIEGGMPPAGVPAAAVQDTTLEWNGVLEVGQSVTITYTVQLNAGTDEDAVVINNHAQSSATPPGVPPITPPPGETEHFVPGYTFTKTSDPASGTAVQAGDSITYTLKGTNTGATALDPVVINDDLSKVLSSGKVTAEPKATFTGIEGDAPKAKRDGDAITWNGTLAVGQSVEITYTVKLNKDAEGVIVNNHASSSATPPGLPPITPPDVETWHPTPGYTFNKTSDPASGNSVQAGDVLTYTLTGSNFGKTVLDPVKINDNLAEVLRYAGMKGEPKAVIVSEAGTVNAESQPKLDGTTLTWSGTLNPGEQVQVTYSVIVKRGMEGKLLKNVAQSTAQPPTGPEITPPPGITEHPVPGYEVTKTSDPESGSKVQPGSSITYTVTGTNTGATVLDTVVIGDDLSKVLAHADLEGKPTANIISADGAATLVKAPALKGTALSWTGKLEVGQKVELKYTVKVHADAANVTLLNVVASTATPPTGPGITPPPATTTHEVPPAPVPPVTPTPQEPSEPGTPPLVNTGFTGAALAGLALVLLLVGAGLMMARRRHGRHAS